MIRYLDPYGTSYVNDPWHFSQVCCDVERNGLGLAVATLQFGIVELCPKPRNA